MYQKLVKYVTGHIDKVLHFLAGIMICLVFSVFISVWLSLLITVAFGLAKEIRDQIVYKGFDWIDLIVTVAGGLFTAGCLILSDIL